ncbi:hypothetical protein [Brevibacillus sp. CF112]|uniref:hypothetical protein n=1 Tax=Brevibacillus TaxID=55080 RepID=UPI000552B376|nr:hypothetical protein [Brevibacillus sp. CF112]
MTVASDDSSVATVYIQGTDLVIAPEDVGIVNITVTADDQKGGTAFQTFILTVTNSTPANAAITNPGRNTRFSEFEVTFDEPLDAGTTAINNIANLVENSRLNVYSPDNNVRATFDLKSVRWDLSNRNRPKLYLGVNNSAFAAGYYKYKMEITFISNQVKDLSGDVTSSATGVIQ